MLKNTGIDQTPSARMDEECNADDLVAKVDHNQEIESDEYDEGYCDPDQVKMGIGFDSAIPHDWDRVGWRTRRR